jgi:nucleoside-diphosphate-sugar epimerase
MVAFVHTSSVASVGFRENKVVTEADWSTVSIEESPYAFAKRKGEETMWEMTRGRSYRVSAINPTMASMREKNRAWSLRLLLFISFVVLLLPKAYT